MADNHVKDDNLAGVRFSSVQQEISPVAQQETLRTTDRTLSQEQPTKLSEEERKELRDLSMTLQQSHMQSARMDHFQFDPVSLPPSRIPSAGSSNQATGMVGLTPRSSPLSSGPSHHPLTPAGSGSREDKHGGAEGKSAPGIVTVTPQVSVTEENTLNEGKPSAAAQARNEQRPKSMIENSGPVPSHPRHPSTQFILPRGDSIPPSNDNSQSSTPTEGGSGAQSPYSRPFTLIGDPNDPYSRSKRAPQIKNMDSVDPRFVFPKDRPKSMMFPSGASSPRGSMSDIPRVDDSSKRASLFVGDGKGPLGALKKEKDHHHGSMSELKRFFRFGSSKKDKRDKSPASSEKPPKSSKSSKSSKSRSGTATPPSRAGSAVGLPFADDHGLEAKYGKFEKILGSGAGGSVRLMKRADGVTFAVKQFREKHPYETEKEYNKKITAEFCIGSTLHHGNVIEAMDIVNEKGRWYEVMEYAPYDLFNNVMTGKMSREEIACCTMQILSGLAYLHSMGLAHRDMKLDNVVVNEQGIMKIIDFGSAHVFRYPFEHDIVLASGIVGSDPYLAPEVYDSSTKYNPAEVDIWSLAIIFCCMTLRRFPWKSPRLSDNSYKLFVTQPTDEELRSPIYPQKPHSEPASRMPSEAAAANSKDPQHRHGHGDHSRNTSVDPSNTSIVSAETSASTPAQQAQTIKGPWRILRLLPRESRHIVSRMLEVDPKKRATLEEIISDPWIKRTQFCRMDPGGVCVRADNHTHLLEAPSSSATPTPSNVKR